MRLGTMLRTWRGQRNIQKLPAITVDTTANHYKAFTAPNPDLDAIIRNTAGDQVGTATYAVPPLSDRVYLFHVEGMPSIGDMDTA